ncbi:hypothetical protein [Streptomyces boncukensis]|uniref:Uncharacterized protein n=1 Tax=Streptomyces boncukensis TaxID=2711219 RepID=A0A6G4WXQ2_9ACTN|nr:hypothetical protein [Streptomyces boncukensis]NGO69304.1 hypothetical protein [Streptomyces boncukensis]
MAAPITVHPPDAEGGRRVVARGRILGTAHHVYDLLDLLQAVGLEPADVRLDDPELIEWRGGGAWAWGPGDGDES